MNKLYVVGIGPGDREDMTERAKKALDDSDIIIGYTAYVDLVKQCFPDKEFLSTPMRGETERCRAAVEIALGGRTAAVISSGDAGVYGMAGLVLELASGHPDIDVTIVPGVTAALSGAALLGAPIGHDFAVISLSDLLTPWEVIEKRLELASEADFAIAIYNPSSHKRKDYLRRACEIILRHASPDTVCGAARYVGRGGESISIMTLGELMEYDADMFTTVFVGSSRTRVIDGKMVTPRGYKDV